MAKRKTRWADGDTRPEPYLYLPREEAIRLGLPPPANLACAGDFYDSNEVARAKVLAQYAQAPPTQADEGWPRLRVTLLALVAYGVGVIMHLILVGAFD